MYIMKKKIFIYIDILLVVNIHIFLYKTDRFIS